MHNKEYALKLVQEKLNGNNNYSYSQIASLTGYIKTWIVNTLLDNFYKDNCNL